jgi:hypothetical protein
MGASEQEEIWMSGLTLGLAITMTVAMVVVGLLDATDMISGWTELLGYAVFVGAVLGTWVSAGRDRRRQTNELDDSTPRA